MLTLARYLQIGCLLIVRVVMTMVLVFATSFAGAQETPTKIQGLSRDDPRFGETIGFTFSGNADDLANAISSRKLGSREFKARIIRLEQHKVTADELKAISTLPNLQTLILGQSTDPIEIEAGAIEELKAIKSLRDLELHVADAPKISWAFLSSLSQLESLEMSGKISLTKIDFDEIGELSSLVALELDVRLRSTNFDWLAGLSRLETLRLQDEVISPRVFAALDELTNLKNLMLFTRKGFLVGKEHRTEVETIEIDRREQSE